MVYLLEDGAFLESVVDVLVLEERFDLHGLESQELVLSLGGNPDKIDDPEGA